MLLAPDRFLPPETARHQGRQGVSGHLLRRRGDAFGLHPDLRADQDLRRYGHARDSHSGHGRSAHPRRHVFQVRHRAFPHLAARRRRGPVNRHVFAPRGRTGQDRRVRLCPPFLLHVPDTGGLAECHTDYRRAFEPRGGGCGHNRNRPEADSGLFHGEPDRLYLSGPRRHERGRRFGRAAFHFNARTGQSRSFFMRRHRGAQHPQAEHQGPGRVDQDHARHGHCLPLVRFFGYRHTALRRVLFEIDGHHGNTSGRQNLGGGPGAFHGRPHHVLPVPCFQHGLFRPAKINDT